MAKKNEDNPIAHSKSGSYLTMAVLWIKDNLTLRTQLVDLPDEIILAPQKEEDEILGALIMVLYGFKQNEHSIDYDRPITLSLIDASQYIFRLKKLTRVERLRREGGIKAHSLINENLVSIFSENFERKTVTITPSA